MCVVLFGACDAGFSSLFPSYLLEESYSDKQVGRINFLAGLIALVFYPFMGKLVDNYNKSVIFNTFCLALVRSILLNVVVGSVPKIMFSVTEKTGTNIKC